MRIPMRPLARGRFAAIGMAVMLLGCFEGTKPEPLRRVGAVAQPKVDKGNKAPADMPQTLYERLGQEEGLQKAAKIALSDPMTAEIKAKVTPQQLGTLLVEASSDVKPSNVPALSATEWDTLKQALREALRRLSVAGADSDEILERLSKGKR
jgi:hypothetical protein